MKILITGGKCRLARAVATYLAPSHSVRVVDAAFTDPLPEGVEMRTGHLADPDFVASVLVGVDTVLHLAPLSLAMPSAAGKRPQEGDIAAATSAAGKRPQEGDAATAPSPLKQDAQDGGTVDACLLDPASFNVYQAARGAYLLATAAVDAKVARLIVGSTLDLFDHLPAHWKVTEGWRPRPDPSIEHLCPWLAELAVRECTRALPIEALCLRFGRPVDDADVRCRPYDPRWLHVDDAVEGVRCALAFDAGTRRRPNWQVFHITGAGSHAKVRLGAAGRESFGYHPVHDMWQEAAAAEGNAGILPTTGDVAGPAPAAPAGRRQMVQAEPLEPGCTSDGPDQEARGIVETGRQEIIAPPRPTPTRPIRNVVVFGAGGPVAAAAVQELVSAFKLRLTDVRPIAEIEAAGKPNYPGAPVPVAFGPPHECRVVDVRDSAAVSEACADMDAILDCTVVRDDPVAAFTVNTVGAYNIARAAVGHGIRRIVLTGPQLVILDEAVGYLSGYDVPSEAPPRPGSDLYGMSKYLGQEIFRVFADWYGLEVPVLLFCAFVADNKVDRAHPFSITWRDSARALRYALTTPGLPSPFEVFNILADLPHGRFTNRKAKSLLGWEPLDSLETAWTYRDV